MAVDGRDGRLLEQIHLGPQGTAHLADIGMAHGIGHIHARGEAPVACAGDDQHAGLLVGSHLGQGLVQLPQHGIAHRIGGRPVQGEHSDTTLFFQKKGFIRHIASLLVGLFHRRLRTCMSVQVPLYSIMGRNAN
jgi:hypothetical protein